MKLLQHDNMAPHYRTAMYQLMDRELGCDFCFGDKVGDIKKMDYSLLKGKIIELKNITFPHGYYQKGMMKMLKADYDTYIICAEPRCITTWTFLLFRKLFYPNKRVYTWGHGMLGKEGWLKQLAYKSIYGMLTGAFIYNERSTRLMIERGIPSSKLRTIYNSLDYDAQLPIRQVLKPSRLYQDHFGNDNKNIVFIGRLTKVKRFDLLLDAIAELRRKGKVINVTFIGDGTERQSMECRVAELNIKDQVWFYGACYDELQNAELIYNADLCVSPGNIGLTSMHVLMFGCPAITNDDFNHQMPEFEAIQEDITGGFFKAGDSSSLAERINKWFELHKDDREQVRRACYNVIDTKWNPHYQIKVLKEFIGFK